LDWVPKQSEIQTDKVFFFIFQVNVDAETAEMIKRRFGEEFHASVAERLEVRQAESRKVAGDRKRKVVKSGKRQQREGKPEGQKTEGETAKPAQTETTQAQEGKKEAPKRERRRGPREGQ